MHLTLLVTEEMEPIPANIKVLEDWGSTQVVETRHDRPVHSVFGRHVYVEAPEDEMVSWLRPFDGIWISEGNPALERFQVVHIREDA